MGIRLVKHALVGALAFAGMVATGQMAGAYAQDLMASSRVPSVDISDERFLVLMAMCVAFAAAVGMVVSMWLMVGRSTTGMKRGPVNRDWDSGVTLVGRLR